MGISQIRAKVAPAETGRSIFCCVHVEGRGHFFLFYGGIILKRILAVFLIVVLMFPTCVVAANSKVYVRIEGYDGQILERMAVTITEPFDLVAKGYAVENSDEFTALHAAIAAMEKKKIPFVCEYGFISKIADVDSTGHGTYSGWMYSLSGDIPPTMGLLDTPVFGGEEIILYYSADFAGMMNANFTEVKKNVTRGQEETFTLRAAPVWIDIDEWNPNYGISAPYGGAMIYVDGADSGKTTDENGQVKLVFNDAGLHRVTAVKKNASDQNILTFNYCDVSVKSNGSSGGGGGSSSVPEEPSTMPEPLPENEKKPKVFSDIPEGYWGKSAVDYTSAKGIFQGVSEDEFAPDMAVTRGMFVIILNRMVGYPDDADPTKWLKGTENGLELERPITREQIAVLLQRFGGTEDRTNISSFIDNQEVADWARGSVEWAVAQGLIQGNAGRLMPKDNVTRIQVATILQRLDAGKTRLDYLCDELANRIRETVQNPGVGPVGGEWAIFGLARGGYEIPASYYENVCAYVRECEGVLSETKYTEYARVVIGLTSAGYNAKDIAGYDLTAPLKDFGKVENQGVNGIIYAILALGTDEYVDELVLRQGDDGSFNSDTDATAMAVQALAKYRDMTDAIVYLKQNPPDTAEGWAQAIVAYCEMGKEPPVEELMAYYLPGRGFSHVIGGTYNQMATEQAFYALIAARRLRDGEKGIWE